MISIRNAEAGDVHRIVTITNDAIVNTTAIWHLTPTTLEARQTWIADRQNRGFPVIVAESDNSIVGFGSFGDFRPFEGYLHSVEHSLYVDPVAQGMGIGKLLLAELIARAEALGKHAIIAGIDATNQISIRLHRGAGFKEVGILPEVGRKFDRWLDLLFMQRLL